VRKIIPVEEDKSAERAMGKCKNMKKERRLNKLLMNNKTIKAIARFFEAGITLREAVNTVSR
jgi:hypothetical protein